PARPSYVPDGCSQCALAFDKVIASGNLRSAIVYFFTVSVCGLMSKPLRTCECELTSSGLEMTVKADGPLLDRPWLRTADNVEIANPQPFAPKAMTLLRARPALRVKNLGTTRR